MGDRLSYVLIAFSNPTLLGPNVIAYLLPLVDLAAEEPSQSQAIVYFFSGALAAVRSGLYWEKEELYRDEMFDFELVWERLKYELCGVGEPSEISEATERWFGEEDAQRGEFYAEEHHRQAMWLANDRQSLDLPLLCSDF